MDPSAGVPPGAPDAPFTFASLPSGARELSQSAGALGELPGQLASSPAGQLPGHTLNHDEPTYQGSTTARVRRRARVAKERR